MISDVADERKKKIRVAFAKNRKKRHRSQGLTRSAHRDLEALEDLATTERVSGKGDLTRRRTVIAARTDSPEGGDPLIDVDLAACVAGRVLYAIGANRCHVRLDDGRLVDCVVRRLVRTIARDARNAVVAGDRVQVRLTDGGTGFVARVDPRRATLSRGHGGREHVIAANVDLAVIVVSSVDPPLKLGVVDRFIICAERGRIRPVICINKVDLADAVALQPIAGVYARIGYDVVLTSAPRGHGLARLSQLLRGRQAVFAGQSGVGKSSLLNALQPDLALRTGEVSGDSGKGRHTTRVAELISIGDDAWVIDTPGIRQLELWDVIPEEVEGYFREFRPFVPRCRFPDCTHTHEAHCGVVRAVDEGHISRLRYESYLRIVTGDE
jgi:ribosome biogenesis GTPase